MRALAVVGLLGRIVAVFAMLMLVPLGFAPWSHDAAETAFLASMGITLVSGMTVMLATRSSGRELMPRDGFLLVRA